jgi:hypothetical protein
VWVNDQDKVPGLRRQIDARVAELKQHVLGVQPEK